MTRKPQRRHKPNICMSEVTSNVRDTDKNIDRKNQHDPVSTHYLHQQARNFQKASHCYTFEDPMSVFNFVKFKEDMDAVVNMAEPTL